MPIRVLDWGTEKKKGGDTAPQVQDVNNISSSQGGTRTGVEAKRVKCRV